MQRYSKAPETVATNCVINKSSQQARNADSYTSTGVAAAGLPPRKMIYQEPQPALLRVSEDHLAGCAFELVACMELALDDFQRRARHLRVVPPTKVDRHAAQMPSHASRATLDSHREQRAGCSLAGARRYGWDQNAYSYQSGDRWTSSPSHIRTNSKIHTE